MKRVINIALLAISGLWLFNYWELGEPFVAFSWNSLLFAIAVWGYMMRLPVTEKFTVFLKKGLQAVVVYAVLQALGAALFLQLYPDFIPELVQNRLDKLVESPAFLSLSAAEQLQTQTIAKDNLTLIFKPSMLILMSFLLHLVLGLINSCVAGLMIKHFFPKKLAN